MPRRLCGSRSLEQYAQHTAHGYCAGCADICEPLVDLAIPISDILRYAMHHHSYGERDRAIALFNALPADVRANILEADFSKLKNTVLKNFKSVKS